ncbi:MULTISPECIES: folate-binding protein YgfZ [Rhodopseudomonas]|uniref:Folate-binding protein n=1 Tax=Rhodopseudomonas palustris TaxID=1076 RepID=A0A0D7EZV2_RHOPL|nr:MULTISPECIES: folate-binding protein YgfZ [Rhodopseudomonas]KIZ44977.1 folate-binding protein [Rhodopseudomonas palustris]MDF3812811.1 folate-binding protein YgfZ [Rhodopseudomonas sp. BAL398]WOK15680.1 folate-binding protein YgfZ [Rhodopseudomonas sp. BAL398]
MKAAFLPDRGVIKVSGDDARHYLNGLFTTDITKLRPGTGRFGALLTPQGKIIADFFITEATADDGGGFFIDCARTLAQPLADKLKFYKLRAKVLVENLSDRLGVLAAWDGAMPTQPDFSFADPRGDRLGWRILLPQELVQKTADLIGAQLLDAAAYEAHRIDCGAPAGGVDFGYGDAFPHEANMDRLHGVDFDKGCYVGQEVVSRMHHRGTARTRIVRVTLDGTIPGPGSDIVAGDKTVGSMGSAADGRGLALMRVDRVADALEAGLPLIAGGTTLQLVDPADLAVAAKKTVA